jgi:hypothetical protein
MTELMRVRRLVSRAFLAASVTAGLVGAASTSAAQSAARTPPDVVKLKDGSMFRGTILEIIARDHVDIQLPSGEVRRFETEDVAYAGDASHAPLESHEAPPTKAPAERESSRSSDATANPRPLVTLEGRVAKVHLEASTPDTDFHIRTGEAVAKGYARLCTAPCDVTLPAGKHRLALSAGGNFPIESASTVDITGPSTVHGTYNSKQDVRIAGGVVAGLALATGLGMLIGSFHTVQDCSLQSVTGSCSQTPNTDVGLALAGIGVIFGGGLVAVLLLGQQDTADIEVVPLTSSSLRAPLLARSEGAWLAAAAHGPDGLGVRLRF